MFGGTMAKQTSLLVNPSVLTPLRLEGPFLVLVALELFMESSTPFQDQASLRLILRLTSRPGSWPFLRLWGASATELSKLAL